MNVTLNTSSVAGLNTTAYTYDARYAQSVWIIENTITPAICVIGIIGNIMNLVILTRRRLVAASDGRLEEAAYCGMAALASSDLSYCCVSLLAAFLGTGTVIFTHRDFKLYFLYTSTYLQNVCSYVSTWFTVVMTVGRYVAICHPFRARMAVNRNATLLAVGVVALVWFLLCLPELWVYSIVYVPSTNATGSQVFLDRGAIFSHAHLHIAFSYLWHTLGFLVPIVIMLFCNIQLVRALRDSRRLRLEHTGAIYPATLRHEMSLTATLILIVALFFVLVSPSEVLQFWSMFFKDYDVPHHNLVHAITNVLNTLNFATNFLLYLGVNVHFRRTLRHILCSRPSISGVEESGVHTTSTRVYRFSSTHL